jgi:hypothetical protein
MPARQLMTQSGHRQQNRNGAFGLRLGHVYPEESEKVPTAKILWPK